MRKKEPKIWTKTVFGYASRKGRCRMFVSLAAHTSALTGNISPTKRRATANIFKKIMFMIKNYLPRGGRMPRSLQILRTSDGSSIFVWRGTVLDNPLPILCQTLCFAPSCNKKQPASRRCFSKSRRLMFGHSHVRKTVRARKISSGIRAC